MPSTPTTQQDPVEEKFELGAQGFPRFTHIANGRDWDECNEPQRSRRRDAARAVLEAAGVPTLLAENKQQQARIEELGAYVDATSGPIGRLRLEGHPEGDVLYGLIKEARKAQYAPTQPDAPEGEPGRSATVEDDG